VFGLLLVLAVVAGVFVARRRAVVRNAGIGARAEAHHSVRANTAARFPRPIGRKGRR